MEFNPLDPLGIFGSIKRDADRIASSLRLPALNPARNPIRAWEVKDNKKIMYHSAHREDIDSVLRTGLRAPVYMMNGREAVHSVEESAREIAAEHGPSEEEPSVLLKIELPYDWPLHIDEAFPGTPMYLVSERRVPPDLITVDNWSWAPWRGENRVSGGQHGI